MKHCSQLIIAATLLLQAVYSQALPINLLSNGSFETLQFGGNWTYKTNPNQVAGWNWNAGSAMEFWNTPFLGVTAVDGTKIAELNAHGGTSQYSFYQTFDTVAGQSYHYSFFYRARSNNNEQFHLGITRFFDNSHDFTSTNYSNHVTGHWKQAQGSFVALGASSQIGFWSDDAIGDSTGNLLDNVVVTTSVREPGSLALLGLGLIALNVSRRKKESR